MCLAIPGRIVSISRGDAVPSDAALSQPETLDPLKSASSQDPLFRTARVDFGGVVKEISLACVPEAIVGEYVLVHAGLALTVLDETAAQQLLAELADMPE
jgi:hydrogenase expression/formation protein HypC